VIELQSRRTSEKVFLAGLYPPQLSEWDVERSLGELEQLARAVGAKIVGKELQRRRSPHPAHFFGPGKAKIIRNLARSAGAESLIVDKDLSPAQARNLEQSLKMKVLDRTELILDIFASRARTRAAKVQVELAQYQYLLPRLTKMWLHLSRTGGGIGTRGPGETQLETDRRLVRARIATLKKRLHSLERHRTLVRRRRREMFRAVLVGYTNAGKSTLMNNLTRTRLPVADMPFVTLDSTTRRLYLDDECSVLLTDTVGFVGRLPHHLVASFHATLEEVAEADLLLVVTDVSVPGIEDRLNVVSETLESIGAASVDRIVVFNKSDLLADRRTTDALRQRYEPDAVSISALRQSGFDDLRQMIRQHVGRNSEEALSKHVTPTISVVQSA
jgi:GTP-binding protein HflX